MSQTKHCSLHHTYFPLESFARPLEDFGVYSFSKDGLQPACKRCKKESHSQTNPEHNLVNNPATNGELYRNALDWVHERIGGRVNSTGRTLWEAAHPGQKWKDLRTTQEAINASEEVFGYSTREAEDYTPPIEDVTTPPFTPRKGSKPTNVIQQHESDEAILYRLLGGDKKEEDWRDFTNPILHIVREYKPKLSKGIVADALGKLVQGQNSYKRRYGVMPTLEFITRVKVDSEVLEDIRTIGAKAFQLTTSNQLVEMAQ